jgi:diketogulonate reductase-like aldo/keto reductase
MSARFAVKAVLFDLGARRFYIGPLVLYPQDFIFLTAIMIISAYALFLFTAVAGRLWCGFACPQTVYTEIFMWVEKKIEGDRIARMRLDDGPWTAEKLWRKGAKQAAWVGISLWTGFTFVGYFTPIQTLAASAASLGFTPDLLLLHWPKKEPIFAETLGALNEARAQGLTRTIGLSNFPSAEFQEAQALSPARLVTNQVEYHPYLKLSKLIETAKALGSSITAWSPLAQGAIADDATLIDIGKAHGKTPGQVTLRWLIQQNVIAIPRTSKVSRAEENFDIFDFRLSDEEMHRIHALARPDGRLGDWIDPAFKWDEEWA